MDIIYFSTNWNNKLSNTAFTTIRAFNNYKYVRGRNYEIQLKEKHICHACAIEVKHIMLSQINDYIALLDTGYDAEETKNIIRKIYKIEPNKDYKLSYILLKKCYPHEIS